MNKQELAAMVAEILSGMEHEPPVKGGDYRPTGAPAGESAHPVPGRRLCPGCDGAGLTEALSGGTRRKRGKIPENERKDPGASGQRPGGARYKTLTMLRFRADHAAAQDAVFSQVSEDFAAKNGMVEVRTKCRDKDEYLTRPGLGAVL